MQNSSTSTSTRSRVFPKAFSRNDTGVIGQGKSVEAFFEEKVQIDYCRRKTNKEKAKLTETDQQTECYRLFNGCLARFLGLSNLGPFFFQQKISDHYSCTFNHKIYYVYYVLISYSCMLVGQYRLKSKSKALDGQNANDTSPCISYH